MQFGLRALMIVVVAVSVVLAFVANLGGAGLFVFLLAALLVLAFWREELRTCQRCGAVVSGSQRECPWCEAPLAARRRRRRA